MPTNVGAVLKRPAGPKGAQYVILNADGKWRCNGMIWDTPSVQEYLNNAANRDNGTHLTIVSHGVADIV
jgi:hypothetical protein